MAGRMSIPIEAIVRKLTAERDEARRDRDALLTSEETLLADNARLRRCLSEHHAAGALQDVLIGEDCPVCQQWLRETPPSPS